LDELASLLLLLLLLLLLDEEELEELEEELEELLLRFFLFAITLFTKQGGSSPARNLANSCSCNPLLNRSVLVSLFT
jgi:hypothetical protein